MARGIIGGLRGARQQNYGNVPQAVIPLDNQAEVVAGHVVAFHFSKKHGGHRGAQNFEGGLRRGHDDDGVAVGLQKIAHDVGGALVGFDGEHHGLLLCGRRFFRRICGETERIGLRDLLFALGVLLRRDELHGNAVLRTTCRFHAHHVRDLRRVESRGGIRIRKCNFELLPFPVSGPRAGEKETVAGDVYALANFFETVPENL